MVGSRPCATTKSSKRVGKCDLFKHVLQHFEHESLFDSAELGVHPIIVLVGQNKLIKCDKIIFDMKGMNFNQIVEIYFKIFTVFNIKYTPEAYNLFFLLEKLIGVEKKNRIAVNELFDIITSITD
jgi:hypothetical protein